MVLSAYVNGTQIEAETPAGLTRAIKKEVKRQEAIIARRTERDRRAQLDSWIQYGQVCSTLAITQDFWFRELEESGLHQRSSYNDEDEVLVARTHGGLGEYGFNRRYLIPSYCIESPAMEATLAVRFRLPGETEGAWYAIGVHQDDDGSVLYLQAFPDLYNLQIETLLSEYKEARAKAA